MWILLSVLLTFPLSERAIAGCLNSQSLQRLSCDKRNVPSPIDATGASHLYRWLSAGDGHRQCRLHPTCSGFFVQATRQAPWQGWLWTLARLQMEHGDQGGLLKSQIASDHLWVYSDPVKLWGSTFEAVIQ